MFWQSPAKATLPALCREHYEAASRLRPGTVRRYRTEMRRWAKLVGDVPVRSIDTEHFTRLRDAGLAAGLRPDTIESTAKVAKAVLRFARDRGWIAKLPVWGRSLPSEPPEPEPATLDELESLYLGAKHSRLFGAGELSPSRGFQCWLALGLWTGLRLHDLAWNLDWSHVLWERGCIRFAASKTGKRHVFPITPPVETHLRSLQAAATPRLFGVHNGQRIDRELARLCEVCGVRKLTAQNIRQASVTQWDSLGVAHLIHGCGLTGGSKVLTHYLGVLQRLNQVAHRFPWPEPMSRLPDRQLKLFG